MKFIRPLFWNEKSFISILLYPLSLITLLINFIKKISYKKNFKIKSICVGNLYVGGTGKTPISMEICKFLKEFDQNPVVIKKKYPDQDDEIHLLKKYRKVLVAKKS